MNRGFADKKTENFKILLETVDCWLDELFERNVRWGIYQATKKLIHLMINDEAEEVKKEDWSLSLNKIQMYSLFFPNDEKIKQFLVALKTQFLRFIYGKIDKAELENFFVACNANLKLFDQYLKSSQKL